MSNERQETIADIVAEMREFADTDSQSMGRDVLRRRIQYFVRRFEAAAKREVAELRKDNVSLRAALKPVLEVYISQDDNSVSVYDSQLDAAFALNAVREAKRIYNEDEERIASPRNCDIGTAEEQSSRFDANCRKHMGCLTCPLREKDGGVPKHCELAWAQMPYEEGAEDEGK